MEIVKDMTPEVQSRFKNFLQEIDPRNVLVDVHGTIADSSPDGSWKLRPGAAEMLLLLLREGLHIQLCTWESPESVQEVTALLYQSDKELKKIKAEETIHVSQALQPYSYTMLLAGLNGLIPYDFVLGHPIYFKYPPGYGALKSGALKSGVLTSGSRIIIDDEYDRPFGPTQSDDDARSVQNNPLFGWTGIPANHPDDRRYGFPQRVLAKVTDAVRLWEEWHRFLFR